MKPRQTRFMDSRIDKTIKKLDYDTYKVFCSPVLANFTLLFLLSPIMIIIILCTDYQYFYLLAVLILIIYLVSAPLNNSIVFVRKKMLIINPNFPFNKQTIIDIKDITNIIIDSDIYDSLWNKIIYLWIFRISRNYIKINTKKATFLFFCANLNLEGYEENSINANLDDLHLFLKQINIPTIFNEKNLD